MLSPAVTEKRTASSALFLPALPLHHLRQPAQRYRHRQVFHNEGSSDAVHQVAEFTPPPAVSRPEPLAGESTRHIRCYFDSLARYDRTATEEPGVSRSTATPPASPSTSLYAHAADGAPSYPSPFLSPPALLYICGYMLIAASSARGAQESAHAAVLCPRHAAPALKPPRQHATAPIFIRSGERWLSSTIH